jgi:hypothetical protein
MLETPWMLRYSLYDEGWVREPNLPEAYGSDNSSAADNQQERLIKVGWISGFVDGEGCFSIHFIRQAERLGRKGYRTGYQVGHEFAVTQGVAEIAETMNHCKSRTEMIRILRDYMPNTDARR